MPTIDIIETTTHVIPESMSDMDIWGPGELDFWEETNIRSRSQRTEVNPLNQSSLVVVDSAVFEYALLHSWLGHPDTNWNLFKTDGTPWPRDGVTINKLFKSQKMRRVRNEIIAKLAERFFPEMVNKPEEKSEEEEAPKPLNPQTMNPPIPFDRPVQQSAETTGPGAAGGAQPSSAQGAPAVQTGVELLPPGISPMTNTPNNSETGSPTTNLSTSTPGSTPTPVADPSPV